MFGESNHTLAAAATDDDDDDEFLFRTKRILTPTNRVFYVRAERVHSSAKNVLGVVNQPHYSTTVIERECASV